jgi:hypothetical protein
VETGIVSRLSAPFGQEKPSRLAHMMFEIWISVALLGIWSCVGVMYRNSKTSSKQLDEVIRLLKQGADRP